MRRLTSIAITAGLAVSLTACAGTPFAPGGCTPVFSSGSNSGLITAEGGFGGDPRADFPTPLVADSPQAQVLEAGDGNSVAAGAIADVQVTIYDGESGELLISTDYSVPGIRLSAVDERPAFGAVVQCATVGSRVAAVGTAAQLLGEEAITSNNLPVRNDDTLVLVVDVLRTFLGKANGVDQLAPAGFPSVVLAPDGRPGFTFTGTPTATESKWALLKAGNGAVVKEGDSVVAHYSAASWQDREVFETTWDRGPAVLVAADATKTEDGSGTVAALAKALIGQRVGSQVIVLLPPGEGFAPGSGPASVRDDATLVYVIDILGIE